jgi:hypothetical protein
MLKLKIDEAVVTSALKVTDELGNVLENATAATTLKDVSYSLVDADEMTGLFALDSSCSADDKSAAEALTPTTFNSSDTNRTA